MIRGCTGRCGAAALIAAVMLCGGCGLGQRPNPSFDLSRAQARDALTEMEANPAGLERPLVVISGYRDIGVVTMRLVPLLRRATGDDRVIGVAFPFMGDFDDCRDRVIRRVEEHFPSDDPQWTTEVDVVAVSMGGLVARYAALERPDEPEARRLRMRRLFTISTPHQGAQLAALPAFTFNQLHRDMRADSRFLRDLNEREANPGYELYPYVRRWDVIVGAERAAPAGEVAWWVPAAPLEMSHVQAFDDPRIIADIARRLRGEEPYAKNPRAPLP